MKVTFCTTCSGKSAQVVLDERQMSGAGRELRKQTEHIMPLFCSRLVIYSTGIPCFVCQRIEGTSKSRQMAC